jgi:alanine racemase
MELKILFIIITIYIVSYKYSLLHEHFLKNNNKNKIPSIFEQIKQNIIKIKNKYKIGLTNGKTQFGFVIKDGYSIIKQLYTMYGHKAIGLLAKFVEDEVDIFYVANIFDGVLLRNYGITKSIMVLYYIEPSQVDYAEKYNLEIVIPNINYINIIIKNIKNNINGHLWLESGLGKEGNNMSELLALYYLIKKNKDINKKIQIVGIGTKYNTSNIKYKSNIKCLNKIPNDIIQQHKHFKSLIKIINNPKLNIHTACTFEVSRNFSDSYFSSVRVGTLIYRNIILQSPIIHISNRKKNDCLGYYCEDTLKLNNFFNKTTKKIKIGLLKNGIMPSSEIKIFAQSTNSVGLSNLIELKPLLTNYDPYAIIIPEKLNLKVGDYVIIKSNDLYAYNK